MKSSVIPAAVRLGKQPYHDKVEFAGPSSLLLRKVEDLDQTGQRLVGQPGQRARRDVIRAKARVDWERHGRFLELRDGEVVEALDQLVIDVRFVFCPSIPEFSPLVALLLK